MNNDFLILPNDVRVKLSIITGYYEYRETKLALVLESKEIILTFNNKEERDTYLKNLDILFNSNFIDNLVPLF